MRENFKKHDNCTTIKFNLIYGYSSQSLLLSPFFFNFEALCHNSLSVIVVEDFHFTNFSTSSKRNISLGLDEK